MTTKRLVRWQIVEKVIAVLSPITLAVLSGVYTYFATGSAPAGAAVLLGLMSLQK